MSISVGKEIEVKEDDVIEAKRTIDGGKAEVELARVYLILGKSSRWAGGGVTLRWAVGESGVPSSTTVQVDEGKVEDRKTARLPRVMRLRGDVLEETLRVLQPKEVPAEVRFSYDR